MSVRDILCQEIEGIRRLRHQYLLLYLQQYTENDLKVAIDALEIPKLNINAELAQRMNKIPTHRRPRMVRDELNAIVNRVSGDILFLERIQYLFDSELKQDPIGLIEYISGNRVVLVQWPGELRDDKVVYGTPGHPEYYEREGLRSHLVIL